QINRRRPNGKLLCWSGAAGERKTHEADAEFLQRPAPRDGLGQVLGQFIEFVVHNFSFVLAVVDHGLTGEILIPAGTTAPFTIRVLFSGVPSSGSLSGLA